MALYAKAEKLAAFGIAALALKLDDANQVAKVAGTSTATAKAAVTTGKALQEPKQESKQEKAKRDRRAGRCRSPDP